MKNIKINVDRPEISSSEILAKQNFEEVLAGHKFMSKPFYKSSWFLGTAGLASLGLIVGGVLSFKLEPDDHTDFQELTLATTEAPPQAEVKVIPISNYFNQDLENELVDDVENEKPEVELVIAYEKTNTQEIINQVDEVKSDDVSEEKEVVENVSTDELPSKKWFSRMDLSPRISGKINGDISRSEILESEGLLTASDVEVISFELHIIDEDGGHVYAQEGHELSEEMKKSIQQTQSGQTIYFEKIVGRSTSGVEVNLNPLRYTIIR